MSCGCEFSPLPASVSDVELRALVFSLEDLAAGANPRDVPLWDLPDSRSAAVLWAFVDACWGCFQVPHHIRQEARVAIGESQFGLLWYATRLAFDAAVFRDTDLSGGVSHMVARLVFATRL